jgi:hypothetical protein
VVYVGALCGRIVTDQDSLGGAPVGARRALVAALAP